MATSAIIARLHHHLGGDIMRRSSVMGDSPNKVSHWDPNSHTLILRVLASHPNITINVCWADGHTVEIRKHADLQQIHQAILQRGAPQRVIFDRKDHPHSQEGTLIAHRHITVVSYKCKWHDPKVHVEVYARSIGWHIKPNRIYCLPVLLDSWDEVVTYLDKLYEPIGSVKIFTSRPHDEILILFENSIHQIEVIN
jgi:hypothetical protein